MAFILLLIVLILIASNPQSFLDGVMGRRKGYSRLPEFRRRFYEFRMRRFHGMPLSLGARDFKKKLKAEGRFYNLGDFYNTKRQFIWFVKDIFKYKKHEWIIIGFCKGRKVIRFWTNKGKDGSTGIIGLGLEETVRICKDEGYDKVLLCHNHPGKKYIEASMNDRYTFAAYRETLKKENIKSEFFIE